MPDDQNLFEVNRTLGGVLATLKSIEVSVAKAEARDVERDQRIADLTTRVASVEHTTAAAKPFIDKAAKWEQRGIGMGMVLTALGAIFGGVVIGMRDRIFHAIGLT